MTTVLPAQSTKKLDGNGKTEHNVKKKMERLYMDVFDAISKVGPFGSVEIYIQDYQVTQITTRRIQKTKHTI